MCSARQKGTFETVYENEIDNMVGLATYLLGSRALGEEAVHDSFVKLHSKWSEIINPGGFLRNAVVNRCKDIMRRRSQAKSKISKLRPTQTITKEHHYLVDVLQTLTPTRRAVVVLKYYGGYTLPEIAEILEIAEGTARSNLHRGIEQLKQALSNEP